MLPLVAGTKQFFFFPFPQVCGVNFLYLKSQHIPHPFFGGAVILQFRKSRFFGAVFFVERTVPHCGLGIIGHFKEYFLLRRRRKQQLIVILPVNADQIF